MVTTPSGHCVSLGESLNPSAQQHHQPAAAVVPLPPLPQRAILDPVFPIMADITTFWTARLLKTHNYISCINSLQIRPHPGTNKFALPTLPKITTKIPPTLPENICIGAITPTILLLLTKLFLPFVFRVEHLLPCRPRHNSLVARSQLCRPRRTCSSCTHQQSTRLYHAALILDCNQSPHPLQRRSKARPTTKTYVIQAANLDLSLNRHAHYDKCAASSEIGSHNL